MTLDDLRGVVADQLLDRSESADEQISLECVGACVQFLHNQALDIADQAREEGDQFEQMGQLGAVFYLRLLSDSLLLAKARRSVETLTTEGL